MLLHGNDLGLISERARQIALHISSDLDDVFSVTRIDGDRAAAEDRVKELQFSETRVRVDVGPGRDDPGLDARTVVDLSLIHI